MAGAPRTSKALFERASDTTGNKLENHPLLETPSHSRNKFAIGKQIYASTIFQCVRQHTTSQLPYSYYQSLDNTASFLDNMNLNVFENLYQCVAMNQLPPAQSKFC